MKLLIKFNLVLLLVFAAGMAATWYVSWNLLEKNAQTETREKARLLMDAALAARQYTSSQVGPLLETQMKYTFLPQSVPAYSATELFNSLRKKYGDYSYKEAVLNPTNPRDRALDWEADLITHFRNSRESEETDGARDTPIGGQFYIARPIRVGAEACMRCHSTVDAAPRTMLEHYGTANGFGWAMNEVVGAQIVSVPVALPLERAHQTQKTFMSSFAVVFLAIAVALNLLLWLLVIRPVTTLSKVALRVGRGEFEATDFHSRTHDEIGTLARSIGRMRSGLLDTPKTEDR